MSTLIQYERPRLAPRDDVPHWSENFCLSTFDRDSGIAIWLHLGRWRKDLRMWRETVIVALPDGLILAHRGYGNRLATVDGPGGNSLSFTVGEPGRRFLASFAGSAVRTSGSELMDGLLQSSAMEPVAFDLSFESNDPLWDLHGHGGKQADFMAGLHLEQIGRISGKLSIAGQQVDYRGMATRDHSQGVRLMAGLLRHHWVQGVFDDGTAFMVFEAEMRGELHPAFSQAAVCRDGKLYEAELRMEPRIGSIGELEQPLAFALISPLGTMEIQRTRICHQWAFTTTHPNDMYIGTLGQPGMARVMAEQPSLFQLNGTIAGYGNVERTIPGDVTDETSEAPVSLIRVR